MLIHHQTAQAGQGRQRQLRQRRDLPQPAANVLNFCSVRVRAGVLGDWGMHTGCAQGAALLAQAAQGPPTCRAGRSETDSLASSSHPPTPSSCTVEHNVAARVGYKRGWHSKGAAATA